LAALVLLVPICWAFAAPALGDGKWLGLSDAEWFWASVIGAIVHQVIVAFVFRAQLGWSILTRLFGKAEDPKTLANEDPTDVGARARVMEKPQARG
jgi:hypothetical protein